MLMKIVNVFRISVLVFVNRSDKKYKKCRLMATYQYPGNPSCNEMHYI